MHVDTCIYLVHCKHFAVINLFFCFFVLPLRYCQFFGQDEFCHYNMFNHHFFDDEVKTKPPLTSNVFRLVHSEKSWYATVQEAITFFQGFLREEGGAKVVMVTDPPFGGLVKPLANSFSQMSMTWKKHNKGISNSILIQLFFCNNLCMFYFQT